MEEGILTRTVMKKVEFVVMFRNVLSLQATYRDTHSHFMCIFVLFLSLSLLLNSCRKRRRAAEMKEYSLML